MTTPYLARLEPLSNRWAATLVDDFRCSELRGEGWEGYATINPSVGREMSIAEAFGAALSDHLLPGTAVMLRLVIGGTTSAAGAGARTWPSVVTRVVTVPGNEPLHPACRIYFSDPLTYLSRYVIWGAFQGVTPGEILGGALSLAAGGDGKPTLEPVLPNMPTVLIYQHLRDTTRIVPYAIAAGDTLKNWLYRVLGRLGVRIEMLGYPSGEIGATLRDMKPTGTPVVMTVGAGGLASAMNAIIQRVTLGHPVPRRGVLLDNLTTGESQRIGGSGPIESVIYGAEIDSEEATIRAGSVQHRAILGLTKLRVLTEQPGILPGRLIEFTNQSINGAMRWQVGHVFHIFGRGRYRNVARLEKAGLAWRPPVPPEAGPIVVSAVVDDGESERGASVSRDRLGRIPTHLSFLPNSTEDTSSDPDTTPSEAGSEPSETGSGEDDTMSKPVWPPLIPLPVVEPMAGGLHGFVSAHRQGDLCRISVQNPLFAEIIGFGYRDNLRVGADLVDVSAGFVVRHGSESWSGMLFRPDEDLEPEEDVPERSEADDNGP